MLEILELADIYYKTTCTIFSEIKPKLDKFQQATKNYE